MTRHEVRQTKDGWTEVVIVEDRECDLRTKTTPYLAVTRRIVFPYADNLTSINQYDEPCLDIGQAEFDVLENAMNVTVRRRTVGEDQVTKTRLVREDRVLLQWSILWPAGQPPPRMEWR